METPTNTPHSPGAERSRHCPDSGGTPVRNANGNYTPKASASKCVLGLYEHNIYAD
jgi:hypothetical protein